MPAGPSFEAKAFFATLFDFSFTTFVTLRFVRVIYGILLGLILIVALVLFIVGLTSGTKGILFSFVVVPIGAFLYIVLARVYMELIAVLFRIGENTSIVAAALGPGRASSDRPGRYGGATPPHPPGPRF